MILLPPTAFAAVSETSFEITSGFFDAAFVDSGAHAIFASAVFPKPVAVPELPNSDRRHYRQDIVQEDSDSLLLIQVNS